MNKISSTTIQNLYTSKSQEVSHIMWHDLTIILGIAAALIGLGFAWWKFQQKAIGNSATEFIPQPKPISETDIVMGKMNLR